MTRSTSLKLVNISLWLVQGLLALCLVWSFFMKFFQPIEVLSSMWPWTSQVSPILIQFTAVVDLCAAIGLILPSLLRIQPRLTPIAAIGIILLMICASVFHILRGEASLVGPNIIFALLAFFIAWGRYRKFPIRSK